jgi:hypothetical protein
MEEVIDFVFRKNAGTITAGYAAMRQETPLEALMRAEEEAGGEEEWKIRTEAMIQMLEMILQGGPQPLEIIRMVLGLAKALRPDLIGHLSLEDIALLGADALQWDQAQGKWVAGRATVSARIKRIYNGTLAKAGARAVKAPFQKSEAAVESFREAQKGNRNRTKNRRRRSRRGVGKTNQSKTREK